VTSVWRLRTGSRDEPRTSTSTMALSSDARPSRSAWGNARDYCLENHVPAGRVQTCAIQVTGPCHKKRTRAAPVHPEFADVVTREQAQDPRLLHTQQNTIRVPKHRGHMKPFGEIRINRHGHSTGGVCCHTATDRTNVALTPDSMFELRWIDRNIDSRDIAPIAIRCWRNVDSNRVDKSTQRTITPRGVPLGTVDVNWQFRFHGIEHQRTSASPSRARYEAIEATGPHYEKRTRAAPVHAELCGALDHALSTLLRLPRRTYVPLHVMPQRSKQRVVLVKKIVFFVSGSPTDSASRFSSSSSNSGSKFK